MVHDMFEPKTMPYSLRDTFKIEQPKTNTTKFGLESLRFSGAKIWNNLPKEFKEEIGIDTFKHLIKTWNGPSCTCGVCTMCKISR